MDTTTGSDHFREEILRRTAAVVDSVVGRGRRPQTSGADVLLSGGGFAPDSLAKINLIMALEEEFGFEIDEATMPASVLKTVATLAQFVRAQLQPR